MTIALRRLALLVVLASLLAPVSATASSSASRYHVSINGLYLFETESDMSFTVNTGTPDRELKLEPGFGLLFAVGFGADVGIRNELEFGYRMSDWDRLDDVESITSSLMANGSYTFEAGRLRPYVGAGVGIAIYAVEDDQQEFSSSDEDLDDLTLAFQVMAGVGIPMSEKVEARVGYRLFVTEDADFGDIEMSNIAHSLEAGVLFRF